MSNAVARLCAPALAVVLLALVACGPATAQRIESATPEAPSAWSGESDNRLYSLTARPESGGIRIGELQNWVVTLTDSAGAPVYPAKISVGGGMKGHGHGLPTQPVVTAYGGGGDYRVEGVRFSMEGAWTLSFFIEAGHGNDRVDLPITVQPPKAAKWDGWNERERALLASMALPADLQAPPSPSNRVADSQQAVELGKQLFFDPQFSGDGQHSCASCHEPERYFTDGNARSQGMGVTLRNAPTIIGSAFNRWFYWDGRRDSLWSQALIPFEAADEMGSSRVGVLRKLATNDNYRKAYEALFEQALPTDVLAGIDAYDAGPLGSPAMREAWRVMSTSEQKAINRAYSNIGKALAAYERTLLPPAAKLDRYVRALEQGKTPAAEDQFDADEMAGARLFMSPEKTQCLQCHNGFMASNGEFHNIGTGNFTGQRLDFGRMFGLRAVLMDEFNCKGPYSDAEENECTEIRFLNRDAHIPLQGSFKTPSLRGLAQTAPYFHDGRFDTLAEVLQFYNEPPAIEEVGAHELRTLDLSPKELLQLERFLLTLSPR